MRARRALLLGFSSLECPGSCGRWCDGDGWCHDSVMKVMCHENYSLQQLWQLWRKKCVSWLSWSGLASIWCSTQSDDAPVWITTQILYDRTKNKYYFWPRSGGRGMTVHLCSAEQTLRSIVSLQGPSDAAAATAMWVGGEEREKMIPEQHHQVYS